MSMQSVAPIESAKAVSRDSCFDNTRISAYKTCPRSYFIRHVLNWRPDGTGNALVFGSSWHNAMDVMWAYGNQLRPRDLAEASFAAFEEKWEEDGLPVNISMEMEAQYSPRTPSIAREMLHNYAETRRAMLQGCEVLAVEQPFAVPMPNIENVLYIGRLDKVINYNGSRIIVEHKTTTAYATQGIFRSDYLESWFMSSQVKGYQFGGSLYYGNVNAVWIDAALVHKKIHDGFKFVPISHNFTLLEEWLTGTTEWIRLIINEHKLFESRGELLPDNFRKNEESCHGKYGACPFIDICRTVCDPSSIGIVPGGFIEEKWEPFSVLGLDKLLNPDGTE